MSVITILVILCIPASILLETVGIWSRVIGAHNNEPTTGYSTHVRVATLGRFFTFLAAPLLGYLVDNDMDKKEIALIGFYSFLLISICTFIFIGNGKVTYNKLYNILNRKKISHELKDIVFTKSDLNKKFFLLVFVSFSFSAIGLIVVNYLAAGNPQSRAMIVQMSAAVTAFGSLLHVFLIDPVLSRASDENVDLLANLINQLLVARAVSSLFLSILFFLLYLI